MTQNTPRRHTLDKKDITIIILVAIILSLAIVQALNPPEHELVNACIQAYEQKLNGCFCG